MFRISSSESLRFAYELLHENPKHKNAAQLKKLIREYQHRQELKDDDRKVFGDYDGYTELIPVPIGAVIYKDEWFDSQIRKTYIPSQYDCTGQHFTIGHRFVTFRGRLYCIHNVGIDV